MADESGITERLEGESDAEGTTGGGPLSHLFPEGIDDRLVSSEALNPATRTEKGLEVVPDDDWEVRPEEDRSEPAAVLDLARSILDQGARIERGLGELQTRFDREIRAESTREKVIDRLHAELQEYKQDLLLNTLRPMFIDLIQLHDDIGKVTTATDETKADLLRPDSLLAGFQQGIEDILYRQGVEPFQVEGDVFDPRRQRAVATVPTDDPAQNKTVAARLRKGFRAGDRVIRPELVSVHAVKK